MPTSQTITIHEFIPVDAISDLTRDEVLIVDAFNCYLEFNCHIKADGDTVAPLSWDEKLIFHPKSSLEVIINGAVLALLKGSRGVDVGSVTNLVQVDDLLGQHDPDELLSGDAFDLLLSGRLMPKSSVSLEGWVWLQMRIMRLDSKIVEMESSYQKMVKLRKLTVDQFFITYKSPGGPTRLTRIAGRRVIGEVVEAQGYDIYTFEPGDKTITKEKIFKECKSKAPGIFGKMKYGSFDRNYWGSFNRYRENRGGV